MQKLLGLILAKRNYQIESTGNSMWPLLLSRDRVTVRKISFTQIKINDLLLVQSKKTIICHRVIYKTPKYLITRGDNNLNSDGLIRPKQILGKVVTVRRKNQLFDPHTLYLIQAGHYFREITKINTYFTKQKIPFCFLKGLPLNLYYERCAPRRLIADCDVLVRPDQLFKAQVILQKQGYKRLDKSLSPFLARVKQYEPEIVYYKNINGFTVTFDLHLEVVFMMTELGKLNCLYPTKWLKRLSEACLNNLKPILINQQKINILAPEFLVLYLALHLFHHNYQGSFRYQLLDQVIRTESKKSRLNWILIARLIKNYRLQNYLYPVFRLLKKYYQTSCPNQFLEQIKPYGLGPKLFNYQPIDIFSEKERVKEGIIRLYYLFILSPRFWLWRFFIFLKPLVLLTGLWFVYQYFFRQKRFR